VKGVIFTELLDFLEDHVGTTGLEEVLVAAGQDGVYSATGNYDHLGAIDIVIAGSKRLGIDSAELMRLYGRSLFGSLSVRYPMFFEHIDDTFTFLSGIQTHIHDEVKALYPDTTPPEFLVSRTANAIEIRYRSHRPFAMIALGMIEACIDHFGENLELHASEAIGAADREADFIVSVR
jgi:hypothetical protein